MNKEYDFLSIFRMPLNKNTPIGYGVTSSLHILLMGIFLQVSICALGFLVGYFKIMTSLGQDIQRKISNFNENCQFLHRRNPQKAKLQLYDIVSLHMESKSLSSVFTSFDLLYERKRPI